MHMLVLQFVACSFQGHLSLFVQGQRCGFEIGKNGGPALFTESFYHSTLSGLPRRRQFLNLLSPFGGDFHFYTLSAPAAGSLHLPLSLQRLAISIECSSIHP